MTSYHSVRGVFYFPKTKGGMSIACLSRGENEGLYRHG